MDRTALYKVGAAAESLKSVFYAGLSVRTLQDLPKSLPSLGVEQQSSRAALDRAKCPDTLNGRVACFTVRGRRDTDMKGEEK